MQNQKKQKIACKQYMADMDEISRWKAGVDVKTYRIHLIRHGQTAGNIQGQYIGRTDLAVTDEGISHLQMLAHKGTYPPVQVVFSSPLQRCLQTLKVLYPDKNPIVVDGLIEYDFGAFEGLTAADLEDNQDFVRWITGDVQVKVPGGESTAEFIQRCVETFAKIVEGLMRTGITDAAICCHGGTIMAILTACGLPELGFYDWMCGNGHGYTLRITPSIWMRGQKAEVVCTLPQGYEDVDLEQERILDTFRGAAHRAYGRRQEEGEMPDDE